MTSSRVISPKMFCLKLNIWGEPLPIIIPKNGSMDEITKANKAFKQWKESTGIEEYVLELKPIIE